MNLRISFFTLLVAPVLFSGPAAAQTPDSGAFFVRLGKDTIAVERYLRTPYQLRAEAALRTPQTRHYELNLTFRDDGGVSWYELLNKPVAGVPNPVPLMRSVTTYVGDSAQVETWVAAAQRPSRAIPAAPHMVPLQLPFYSTYETALLRARKAGTDTVTITMLSQAGPLPYKVNFFGADSVTLFNPDAGTMRGRLDAQGRLLGLSGEATTFKVVVTRARTADVEAYLRHYAALDSAGKPVGALSPRDSMEADLGPNGVVYVNYGRPSKRGRQVFGGIVPWGQVWRTGANAASWLHFSRPVEINGVKVPPGNYSLWTIPDPKQWTLILNRQTRQWGTAYDSAQDFARIPVRTETMPVPVETFTIDFVPDGESAKVMRLMWDRTRVLVPIKATAESGTEET